MRFNFISETADGFGFALRIMAEGNDVRLWIHDHDAIAVGDFLVPKVGGLEDLVEGAGVGNNVFIFDTSGNGVIADGLRSMGYLVLGGSVIADRLEKDRAFARKAMEDFGIDTPKTYPFSSFDDAIEFTSKLAPKDRMVYKPSGRLGEVSSSLISADREDLVFLLETLKAKVKTESIAFDLQEFVEGIEISSEGWFDGYAWLPFWNHTFERKQLMPGNLGPSGGCTGNVVWMCTGECPICRNGIRKMERFLRLHSFKGMIDLNTIVTKDKVFGLEFTPRMGYDATPTLFCQLATEEIGQIFADVAKGRYFQEAPFKNGKFAAAIKVSIPPWPSEEFHAEEGVAIRGFSKEDEKNIYWYNIKGTPEDDMLVSAGAWGMVGLTMATSSTVNGAFHRAYEIADSLKIQNKQYRNDLGKEFERNIKELDELGIYQHMG